MDPPTNSHPLRVPAPTDRALTVMQILPTLHGGGVERGTAEISAALTRRGHRSLVVSGGGALVSQIESEGGTHLHLDLSRRSPLTLRKVRRLRKLITDQQVDLVHVRSRMPAWVAYFAWRGLPRDHRPRFVTTVHGLNSVNWYSKIMTAGERVIAVSNCCRDFILQNYPTTDPEKIVVIHRGVASEEFPFGYRPPPEWQTQWNSQFPQLQNRFVVLLPGRITRFKGHFDFIDVINRLKRGQLPVHGLIVGGEAPRRKKYAESLRAEIKRCGLDEDITFTGHRADIREVMSVADAVVSTSTKPPESFGRTVLEAIRLGRPTVGYDHGGVGEVMARIYPEGRVPLSDTVGLADKLAQIFHGQLAPPKQTSEFELQTMVDTEIQLYEDLVLGHSETFARREF